jgi:GLPGLI family protein
MKLFTLFFLMPFYIFCQSNRFVYEYKNIIDTIKSDTIKKLMYLDVYKQGSIFYDVQNFKNDSIASLHGEKLSQFENRVYKEYPDNISLITCIYNDIYIVPDLRKMNWKILPEKKQINKYMTQKATLNFAGRMWTAWFSTDIPISDGPYKFHGLPGLILKLQNNNSTHIFELVAIEKVNGTLSKKTTNQKLLTIDDKTYRKLYREYRENPTKNLIGIDISETQDGKTSNDFKKNMQKYYKSKLKKDNNLIEIDLLKN